jgi:peptidyl-prolyl isomerase G (cyclophilin G)
VDRLTVRQRGRDAERAHHAATPDLEAGPAAEHLRRHAAGRRGDEAGREPDRQVPVGGLEKIRLIGRDARGQHRRAGGGRGRGRWLSGGAAAAAAAAATTSAATSDDHGRQRRRGSRGAGRRRGPSRRRGRSRGRGAGRRRGRRRRERSRGRAGGRNDQQLALAGSDREEDAGARLVSGRSGLRLSELQERRENADDQPPRRSHPRTPAQPSPNRSDLEGETSRTGGRRRRENPGPGSRLAAIVVAAASLS